VWLVSIFFRLLFCPLVPTYLGQMPTLEHAKANKRFEDIERICNESGIDAELYTEVLHGIARNVKMGPFLATSGVMLPYYLNAATNFFDPLIAPKLTLVFSRILGNWLPPSPEKYLVCGMEMAGGILAGQLAAAGLQKLNDICDFVYIRKAQKSTGTCQHLEGPNVYTRRTAESPPVKGVWVDDANSTGSSLKEGVYMLKTLYNIHITHALYLVDRYQDRADLPVEKQHYMDPVFDDIEVRAIYDLGQVDDFISQPSPLT